MRLCSAESLLNLPIRLGLQLISHCVHSSGQGLPLLLELGEGSSGCCVGLGRAGSQGSQAPRSWRWCSSSRSHTGDTLPGVQPVYLLPVKVFHGLTEKPAQAIGERAQGQGRGD